MKITAIILIAFILFIILSPGILLVIPLKKNKLLITVVHGIIFAIILTFIITIFINQEGVIVSDGTSRSIVVNNNLISEESAPQQIFPESNQINYEVTQLPKSITNNQLNDNLTKEDDATMNNYLSDEENFESNNDQSSSYQCMCPKPLDDKDYKGLKIDVSEYESKGNIKIKNKTYAAFNPSDPSVGCTDKDYFNNCGGKVCDCPKKTTLGKKKGTYRNYYGQCDYDFGGMYNIDSCNT